MRAFKLLTILAIVIVIGCSDSDDSPTSPGGGGETGLSVNNVSGTEGGAITFTVSLNVAVSSDVIFDYATSNGTATSDDYTTITGTDTITAGNLTATIQVNTTDDTVVDKNETFTLTISNAMNADISDASGVATIIDNDMSFSLDVRPLIQNNSCLTSGCHGTGSTSGGYSLGAGSYSNVINAVGDHGAIVVAGDASVSNFYLKLTSSPPFGSRMPLGRSPLSTTDINKIRDWINQGALNN